MTREETKRLIDLQLTKSKDLNDRALESMAKGTIKTRYVTDYLSNTTIKT